MFIENVLANTNIADVHKIDNYLNGGHSILGRKNFQYKGETFETAKIVLQSIKSIIDFHSSYICGNPISLTGEKEDVSLLQSVYKKGNYNKTDYDIAKNIYTYGNAYEYIYREKGIIKSKVINNSDAYPIYENGTYTFFIERWVDGLNSIENEIVYTDNTVEVYENGVLIDSYRNTTGLPIHYTNGNLNKTNIFGTSMVNDLIHIMNQIELLLSKMSDAVTTLSMNPLGVSSGDRVESSVDTDVTGAILNIESGGDFKWATAELDANSIKIILDNLLNQFFTIACVPSALYGQSNIANVSEVSLKLLFNNSDSMAKRVGFSMQEGFNQRLEFISKLLGVDVTMVNISFNFNRPIDNSSLLTDLKTQYEMGAISKESIIRNSPYTSDIDRELELISREQTDNKEIEQTFE